jgi:hypothetical protein
MSHAWDSAGQYSVRARAKDEKGLMSDWSNAHLLTFKNSLWTRLRLVGQPVLAVDSSGFLIHIANDGTVEDTVNWILFKQSPDSAYMRTFWVRGTPYPIAAGQPGMGQGDTVDIFTPFVVQPNMSEQVELMFMDFYIDIPGDSARAHVDGDTFRFRFSDGSEITAMP